MSAIEGNSFITDHAAMKLDEMTHDRQSQTKSAVFPGCAAVALAEAFEDRGGSTSGSIPLPVSEMTIST